MADKTVEVKDNDYSLTRVPAEGKQPMWKILMVRIGALCCVSQLALGASLGFGMTFWGAFWATMLGSVILQVVSWAMGTAAAREGLSTSLLTRWCGLGKGGSAIFGLVVAICMLGWFGYQNAVFGQGLYEVIGILPLWAWMIITGVAVTALVAAGMKWISNFASIFVPLFIVVVLVSFFIVLGGGNFTIDLGTHPGPELAFGTAVTMVAGGFIAGAICTPDYGRFLRNGKEMFWMTLIGTFLGELGMNLIAVVLANATGTENIVAMMMATSGVIGVCIVVASTVKLNDMNLYSAGLGAATAINALFNVKINRNILVWVAGIIGTAASIAGMIDYLIPFLTFLGVLLPPVAGILVSDYFILKRNRKALDESREAGELPKTVENWNPIALVSWVIGTCVGYFITVGIPGLQSLLTGAIVYIALMYAMAAVKKVPVSEMKFKETDQVL